MEMFQSDNGAHYHIGNGNLKADSPIKYVMKQTISTGHVVTIGAAIKQVKSRILTPFSTFWLISMYIFRDFEHSSPTQTVS